MDQGGGRSHFFFSFWFPIHRVSSMFLSSFLALALFHFFVNKKILVEIFRCDVKFQKNMNFKVMKKSYGKNQSEKKKKNLKNKNENQKQKKKKQKTTDWKSENSDIMKKKALFWISKMAKLWGGFEGREI